MTLRHFRYDIAIIIIMLHFIFAIAFASRHVLCRRCHESRCRVDAPAADDISCC